jgi:hypothetical protein
MPSDNEMVNLIKDAAQEGKFDKMSIEELEGIYHYGFALVKDRSYDNDLFKAVNQFKVEIERRKGWVINSMDSLDKKKESGSKKRTIAITIISIFIVTILSVAWYKSLSLPPGEIEKEDNETAIEKKEQREKVINCFNSDNFTELDDYAHKLRTEKIRNSYGEWKLFTLYQILSEPVAVEKPSQATEEEWQNYLDKFAKWINQNPSSITARIAYAGALVEYAWKARGGGYASEVTEDGWRLFKERIAKAEQILNEAKTISEKCPHWYTVMSHIATAQGWDIERYNKLFKEAISIEPLYEETYLTKASYLMPRWHGRKGDVEKFAEEVINTLGGKEAYRIYYLIVTNQIELYGFDSLKETEFCWEKIIKGYEASQDLYGFRVGRLNYFCNMALKVGDYKTARKAMRKIGTNIAMDVWGNAEYYNKMKEKALNN